MESLVHAMLSNALAATVLAVFVAILGRACRRPALIHGLWLVVMLKLVTPPVVPVSLPVGPELLPSAWTKHKTSEDPRESIILTAMNQDLADTTSEVECDADPACAESRRMPDSASSNAEMGVVHDNKPAIPAAAMNFALRLPAGWAWEHVVLILVFSGAVAWWILALVRIIRFNRLIAEVNPAPEEWQTHTAALAAHLGLGEPPALYLVPGRVPPMLWAIGRRPRLLVPSELWSATSLDQRTSLLLHELAHLRRRDHWVRWLELIVGGLYWWLPTVWWGRRLLREAEEHCCDAWVVWAMPKGAKTYATALLTALEFVSGARTAPAAASATSGNGHVSCLKRRLKMIVRAQTPKGLSWAGRLAVVSAAACLLPLAPSWGQKNDLDEPAVKVSPVATFYEYNAPTSQDDATKDEPTRDDEGRATAERFEEHVKDLIDKLAKELGPVGEELRKILEKSIDDIHETLKKEGVAPEDLRKALEKSHNEMRRSLEKGGSVNKEVRGAMEKSRRDLREEWERARNDFRMTMRDRAQPRRSQERAEEAKKDADQADSAKKEAEEIEKERAELEKARSEIRALEQQLRQANRRLVEMQRRTMQRRGPAGRRGDFPGARTAPGPAPGEKPSEPEATPRPARPATPATPATPRRAEPPVARRPVGPRAPQVERGRSSDEQREYDRRLQNLDNKLEELLKEFKKLKEEKKPEASKSPGPRRARSANPGTPVIY
jgi:beta-lactamase regulating signal transducer with metallopeptidase domain